VYAVTEKNTFERVKGYVERIQRAKEKDTFPMVLVCGCLWHRLLVVVLIDVV
jgi:hypothetical protein